MFEIGVKPEKVANEYLIQIYTQEIDLLLRSTKQSCSHSAS